MLYCSKLNYFFLFLTQSLYIQLLSVIPMKKRKAALSVRTLVYTIAAVLAIFAVIWIYTQITTRAFT